MPFLPIRYTSDWLHANYPSKLSKRWQQVKANEELRRVARLDRTYGQIYNDQHQLVRAPAIRVGEKAEEFYRSRIGRKCDPSVGSETHLHPYDRMLVVIKPTYETTLYCPANWVRTKYDGQWWAVAKKPTYLNRRFRTLTEAEYNSRLYAFLHLFIPQDELMVHHKTIDPAPRVWVSMECTMETWLSDTFVLPRNLRPPASHPQLPHLKIKIVGEKANIVEYKDEKHTTFFQTEIEITAIYPQNGGKKIIRVTRFQYRGEWSARGTGVGSGIRVMDRAMTFELIDFLYKVDRVQRSYRGAPIVIERTDTRVRECEGSFMIALSLLRACNFQRRNKFDSPIEGGSIHQRKLETARNQISPLKRKFRANYSSSDKVLNEAHNILEQCAGILGFEKAEGVGKSALGLVYEILVREEERMKMKARRVPQRPGPVAKVRVARAGERRPRF